MPRPNAEKPTGEARSSTPPVVRAVVLPPLADVPLSSNGAEAQPASKPDGGVPRPVTAATAVVEPPFASGLELAEVHVAPARNDPVSLDAPPPISFTEEGVPISDSNPGTANPSGSPDLSGAGAEVVAEAVTAIPSSSLERPAAFAAGRGIAQPKPDADHEVSQPAPSASAPQRRRSPVLLAALWAMTAAVPAAAVWVIRTPAPSSSTSASKTLEYRAQTVANSTAAMQVPSALPAAKDPETQVSASTSATVPAPSEAAASAAVSPEAAASAAAASAPSAASSAETSTAPTSEIVVATDARDRVSVLVKTRPEGARVLRRGKEIGRTPVTILIGRGEHRIFEVSMPGFGSKRITLDGDKPEILVNMAVEAKPQTIYVPAPLPTTKYERLQ